MNGKRTLRTRARAALRVVLGAALLLPMGWTSGGGASAVSGDLARYIDREIGSVSGNGSNTVLGPQRPSVSVNPWPDTNPQISCADDRADGRMRGFSQIPVSGAGIGKYGQFLVSPQVGLSTRLDGHDSDKSGEFSTCDKYGATLDRYDIDCALAPAAHSAIYKFAYPAADNASLLIDLAHNITEVNATDLRVDIKTDEKGRTVITGSGYYPGGRGPGFFPGGWGEGHSLYFYAVVNKEAKVSGVYDPSGAKAGVNSLGPVNVSDRLGGLGAYMTFDTKAGEEVYMKMGVSFQSVDQAREWLEDEIPAWDYDAVKAETRRQWNEELHKIVIGGNVSETDKQLFYTALYHAHVMPRDRTGDFSLYGDADMMDDHFALWDTWRTLYPLYTITNPDLVAKTVNSFIARSQVNGGVRDSFVAGKDMVEQQGGDNVDNVIAEAYLKGIEGIDWDKAYQVVKKNAEDYRLDWQGWGQVSPGDSYYKSLGWIPGDDSAVAVSTCSYQMEYAYNDYCAAQLAKAMGDEENYQKWLERSHSWTNIWNPEVQDSGYSGFIWPKAADGGWVTDSRMQSPAAYQGSWSPYFYEGTSWNYSFFIPHDIPLMIEKMGGEETFCDRLTLGLERGWVDFGNEPAFLAPYLYAYTSKPYLTTDGVALQRKKFNLNGVPGNDDSGAMSSWYIFSSIGFFPNAGQDLYYFTSPCYPETTLNLDNGKSLKLTAKNLSDTNKYIQSITINGQPYKSTMFSHDVIVQGGEIVFEMGAAPVDYAKETAAVVESTDQVSDSVRLDEAGWDEWVHFSSAAQINRKAGVTQPALVPDGLPAGGLNSGVLDSGFPGLSWKQGTPQNTADNHRGYVWSGEGLELPIRFTGGDARAELFVTSLNGPAVLEVLDGKSNVLTHVQLPAGPDGGRAYNRVRVRLGSGGPEAFTLRVLAGPAGQGGGGQVGVSAVGLENLAPCVVSFDAMEGGAVPNQTVRKGGKAVRPEDPKRSGYRFDGWYADDMLTVPWDFARDTVDASLTLYAKWTMLQGAFIESIQVTPNNTLVDLSGYDDWMHFGDGSHDVIHCDRKNLREKDRAFGQLVNIDNQREENELNSNQPFAFTWTGGTPVEAAVEPNRYFSWTRNGMELPVTVPAGSYACVLYLSGIRSRGTVEVLGADGSAVVEARQLWANTGESRQYRTVTLQFHNTQPQAYIIRLLVDLTDTERENYSMAIAAAALYKSMFEAQVQAGGHGQASLRGGNVHKAGKTVTATARPEEGYQFAGWEVVQGDFTLERPMQNPLAFTMPADDIVLQAAFTKHVVSVKTLEPVAQRSVVNLSDAGNMDWAYLGRGDGMVRKADVADSAFTGQVIALDDELNKENMAHTNPDSPGFDWSGGTPIETGSNVREILWSADGLQFDLRLPQGRYETVLYLSGVRAGVIAEVLDQRGNLLMDTKLWDCMQDYRPYRKLTLSMDCETAQRFTVRLRVDPSDTHADWYSVSLYAAAIQDLAVSARPGCVYDLNAGTGIVSGIQAGTTIAQLTAGFGGSQWVGIQKDGQEVIDGLAGTGMTAQYKDGGQESYTVAVTGDLDGDGQVSIADVMEACKILARAAAGTQPTALELAAGDLDGQAGMSISDVMELCKMLARMA